MFLGIYLARVGTLDCSWDGTGLHVNLKEAYIQRSIQMGSSYALGMLHIALI